MKKLFLIAMVILIAGCSKQSDSDKVGDAQICLNSASTSAQVNSCLEKVEGLETTAAYATRCNGAFIREGFANPSKYSSAFSNLSGGSSTATMDFMGFIMFASQSTIAANSVNATSAFNNCFLSGAKGTTLIAAMGGVATTMYNYLSTKDSGTCSGAASCASAPVVTNGVSTYNLTTCSTCFFNTNAVANAAAIIQMFLPTSTDADAITFQTSIGSIVVSTYSISCASSSSNQQLCTTMNTAITAAGGISNTRKVGTKFICAIAGVSQATCP
jgi:hypothetical protein